MIRAFFLAVRQLGDPPVLRLLAKTLLITLLVIVGLAVSAWWAAGAAARHYLSASYGPIAALAAVLGVVALGWLFFRAIAIVVLQLFGDDVVAAVEARYYPHAHAVARPVPPLRALGLGLGSAARAVLINLALVPLYLVLLVSGAGTPLLFLLVNGWLLGHDLAELVGARHLPPRELRRWIATTRASRLALGLIVAGLFTVPFVNLVAPVIGAAMAAHLFHARRAP